jgi:hypothetical protein
MFTQHDKNKTEKRERKRERVEEKDSEIINTTFMF